MAKLKGEPIRLKATFTDASGSVTDPTVPVNVRIKDPFGNIEVSSSAATKQSIGVYQYTHTFEHSGLYIYRFESADGSKETRELEIKKDETQ